MYSTIFSAFSSLRTEFIVWISTYTSLCGTVLMHHWFSEVESPCASRTYAIEDIPMTNLTGYIHWNSTLASFYAPLFFVLALRLLPGSCGNDTPHQINPWNNIVESRDHNTNPNSRYKGNGNIDICSPPGYSFPPKLSRVWSFLAIP